MNSYVVRENGHWLVVTPFGLVSMASLGEACEFITTKK